MHPRRDESFRVVQEDPLHAGVSRRGLLNQLSPRPAAPHHAAIPAV